MKVFDHNEIEKHKAEAKERWGRTSAYKEYETKTESYSEDKWNDSADGMDHIFEEFALCMKNGETSDSVAVQALVKHLQTHITENYYCCTNEILSGLGRMYAADERFRNCLDQHAAGTAEFVAGAIETYCGK